MNRNFIVAITVSFSILNSYAQSSGQTVRGTVVDTFTESLIIHKLTYDKLINFREQQSWI